MEKTVNYMKVCLQDKIKSSNSKDLTEMCLQKSSVRNFLKNSTASKILGNIDSEGGDRISCSLTTRKIQKETQEKHTKEKGTESFTEVRTSRIIYCFSFRKKFDPDRFLSISIRKTKNKCYIGR